MLEFEYGTRVERARNHYAEPERVYTRLGELR